MLSKVKIKNKTKEKIVRGFFFVFVFCILWGVLCFRVRLEKNNICGSRARNNKEKNWLHFI